MIFSQHVSMRARFLRLLVPITCLGLVVSAYTWSVLKNGTGDLTKIKELSDLSLESRYHISEMGAAMNAYMLNPQNQAEYDRKQKADEDNGHALAEMTKVVSDEGIKLKLAELAELDETRLNPAENKVMNLVRDGKFDEAKKAYAEEYLPLRTKYDELSKTVVELTKQYSDRATDSVDAGMRTSALQIIALLLGGLIMTNALFFWTVSQFSKRLRELAEELSSSTGTIGQASDTVADASTGLSKGATEAASSIEETNRSLIDLNEIVRLNATRASEAARASLKNRDTAVSGRNSVKRMSEAITSLEDGNSQIAERMEESNKRISEITTLIQEIGDRTKVINDIVFQTKLLSFNASVEAARAGEAGKGFAVVAEEVGNLAHMSGNASKEISDMLNNSIQRVTQIVDETKASIADIMSANHERIAAGRSVSDECASALDEIVRGAEEVEKSVQEIAGATESESQRVHSVSSAVNQLEGTIAHTASSARESSETATNMRDESARLREIVHLLNRNIDGRKAASRAALRAS